MTRSVLFLFFALLFRFCPAQETSINELTDLLKLNTAKLEVHLVKNGFRVNRLFGDSDDASLAFLKQQAVDSVTIITRCYKVADEEKGYRLIYQTSSEEEYKQLCAELKKENYFFPSTCQAGKA